MSALLGHPPDQILARLLAALGLGVTPPAGGAWPVWVANEPATPDNVVTVFKTANVDHGRGAPDNQRVEYEGAQVRVRAVDHPTGWARAHLIATTLDQVENALVTIGVKTYKIQTVTRAGGVLALGDESATSKRKVFTVNVLFPVDDVTP